MCSLHLLATTTTTTHVLLPKGRHTAARQRVKAARQFSGWSPAARFPRSTHSLNTPLPLQHCRAPHLEMIARCEALTQSSLTTLSLPPHVAQHHSRGTARDEVLTLPSRPLSRPPCEVLWFSSPPCIAWNVSIAYPKKCISSSRSPPGRASPSAHSAVQLAEASPGPFA